MRENTKKRTSYVFFTIFGILLIILLGEMLRAVNFHRELSKGKIGLPEDSATYDLASQDKERFLDAQMYATHTRFKAIIFDIIRNLLYIFISLLFLIYRLQTRIYKYAQNRITILGSDFRDLKKSEINYLTILLGGYVGTILLMSILKTDALDYMALGYYLVACLGFFYFIFPTIIVILYSIFGIFGKWFIIACYLAYGLKVLSEILIQDDADLSKMEKVDIDIFPENVQSVLQDHNLQDRVFIEIEPTEDSNAALIGYGLMKRMEIYGDIKNFSKNELYAILLHEIGHVDEHSLVRKTSIYFLLLFSEMIFLIWLYTKLSHKYSNEDISNFTAFCALFIIYYMLIRQYSLSIERLTSISSEKNADLFAKKNGFQVPLANALYEIAISSKEYLRPTFTYNMFRNTHPSIFERVEVLKGPD